MAHDVMISYSFRSERDKKTADAICAALEAERIRCWIAPRDVTPGTGYGEAIVRAIDASSIMVLVFSKNSNQSQHVTREAERAVSKELIIIPFRIDDTIPTGNLEYFLSATHWLDALTPPLKSHISRLVTTVQQLIAVKESEPGVPRAPANEPAEEAPAAARRGFFNRSRLMVAALAVMAVIAGAIIAVILLTPSRVTVPDIEGLFLDEAREVLREPGLELEIANEVPGDSAPEGEIASQSPAAGQRVAEGSVVEVDVYVREIGFGIGAKQEIEEHLRQRVADWEAAFENEDIDGFMSFYTQDFTAPHNPEMADYGKLRENAASLFDLHSDIQVTLTEIEVLVEKETEAQMSFRQRTTYGDSEDEYGDKLLRWKKIDGEWMIWYEQWWELPS